MDTITISLAGVLSIIRLPVYLVFHNLTPNRSLKEVVGFINKAKNHHLIFVIFDLRHTKSTRLNLLNYTILIFALCSLIVHFI